MATPLVISTTLAAELGHNTCANPAYAKALVPANFTGTSATTQAGATMPVNPALSDDSFNPVTPCHVSSASVHTLFPGYTGKVISQLEPYNFGGNHINIGVNTNAPAWAKAVCENEQLIGTDGVTIDWYGPNRYEDDVTLLLKTQIESMSDFTFAIMIDTSGGSYSTTAQLESYLAYLNTTYFPSKAYQKINGKNVLILWGTPVAGVDYTQALAPYAANLYVITQGLTVRAWTNSRFDWVQPYLSGVSASDPYNLAGAKQAFVNGVKGNTSLGCVLAVSPGFNGTLTRTVAWSKGKYMPRNNGACWLAQAKFVAANLLPNLNFIWIVTGCGGDWEEGTQVGSAIDNGVSVSTSIEGQWVGGTYKNTLNWSASGGGGISTLSGYSILISPDGVKAAKINLPLGTTSLDLSTVTGWETGVKYSLYVVAVGAPCIRNKVSAAIVYAPVQTVTGAITGTFNGTISGNKISGQIDGTFTGTAS